MNGAPWSIYGVDVAGICLGAECVIQFFLLLRDDSKPKGMKTAQGLGIVAYAIVELAPRRLSASVCQDIRENKSTRMEAYVREGVEMAWLKPFDVTEIISLGITSLFRLSLGNRYTSEPWFRI